MTGGGEGCGRETPPGAYIEGSSTLGHLSWKKIVIRPVLFWLQIIARRPHIRLLLRSCFTGLSRVDEVVGWCATLCVPVGLQICMTMQRSSYICM